MNIPNNAFFRHRFFKPFRIALGTVFILFGAVGFLPIVGYWMVPAGLAILAIDVPWAKRAWDKLQGYYVRSVDWARRRFPKLPWSWLPMPEPEPESPQES